MTHLLIVAAPFYRDLTSEMIAGAKEACAAAKATCEVVEVPGALEIPTAIRFALEYNQYDGYVALGCVLRGETYHFEIVSNDSARGLTWLAIENKAAIGNGILTCDTEEQAWARARRTEGNKGGDAVKACLALLKLKHHFEDAS